MVAAWVSLMLSSVGSGVPMLRGLAPFAPGPRAVGFALARADVAPPVRDWK
jgi:hypothetical protein